LTVGDKRLLLNARALKAFRGQKRKKRAPKVQKKLLGRSNSKGGPREDGMKDLTSKKYFGQPSEQSASRKKNEDRGLEDISAVRDTVEAQKSKEHIKKIYGTGQLGFHPPREVPWVVRMKDKKGRCIWMRGKSF